MTFDGGLWHRWQPRPGKGPWLGWRSLGKPGGQRFATLHTPPTLVSNIGGRLELFVVTQDRTVWHRWQTAPNGDWSAWESLGAPDPGFAELSGDLLVVRNQDGRLELFAGGDSLWHRRQAGPGQGPWEPWSALPAPGGGPPGFGMMAVGAHADGRLVMFNLVARTAQDAREVWLREQRPPDDEWSVWISFGRPAKMNPAEPLKNLANIRFPTLVSDSQGRLELMSAAPGLVNQASTMFFALSQRTPSGAKWSDGLRFLRVPPESSS
jgi:hypothetical protein